MSDDAARPADPNDQSDGASPEATAAEADAQLEADPGTNGADPGADGAGPQPEEQPDRQAMPVDTEQAPRLPFPVVGIGASAGGVEAFMAFLEYMRPDSGMAFVLIQHLPPQHESMMADVLSKRTAMRVLQVEAEMPVQPNHVYVIRPGHVLTIRDGRFHLGAQLGRRAANRPVDDFFKSLAEEQRERAIAVVMSGMGSNGSAGAQAVKAVGGLVIAQDPDSAQFPSMPRHLIDQGYADYILAPADIPDVLLQYAGHPYAREERKDPSAQLRRDANHLREIIAILRTRTRTDFTGYKKPTLLRRIQRRMGLTRLTDMGEYAKLLRQSPSEVTALSDDLLIHVTGFFRDHEAWEALRERVVVPLVARREPESEVRAWVTACSSGEEAYSLAMLLVEEAERAGKPLEIKVFATDMADRPLGHARAGVYPGGIESDMPPDRLERFFEKEDGVYRVRQFLRECVIFAPQNVLSDPPFSRLDIATCRNLLIYREPDVQQRVLNMLHFGLREGGALFLGSSETVAGADDLFELVDKKSRIYRRVGPTRHGTIEFPLPHPIRAGGGNVAGPGGNINAVDRGDRRLVGRPSLAALTHRTLLEHHTPAAVTVDRDHRVLYFHGNTRPFVEQPPGEPTRDLMALLREGLRGAARIALHRAAAERSPATVPDGWISHSDGRHVRVTVTASPVTVEDFGPDYFVLSFVQREEIRSAVESGAADLLTDDQSGDELRRVRDELQSTIEELQSSNEELETSKEEMQSLNEELTTVNAQLQVKMDELQSASNDLTSLLTSTDIAVLFLDTNLRIRRYTPAVRDLMDLIASDSGRPLTDLNRKFDDPDLNQDVHSVLDRLVPAQREITAHNGRTYMRRALPYRTTENRIDGVVLTFVDITARKSAEQALAAGEEQFRRAIEEAPVPVILQTEDGQVLQVSRSWTDLTGFRLADVPTADAWLTRAYGPGAEQVRQHMHDLFKGDRNHLDAEFTVRTRRGDERYWSFSASAPGTLRDGRRFVVGMAVDLTERQRAEQALRDGERQIRHREEQFRLVVEGAREFAILMLDASGTINTWNSGAERLLGWTAAEAIGRDGAMIFTREDREAGVPAAEQQKALRDGRAEDERWHIRKDGSLFWGSGVMTALRSDTGGEVRGFVKILRDETPRKRVEEALQASKESAELANRMKDEFLATLSHELRTPLSSILIWSKMLRRRADAPPEYAEAMDAITSAAEAQKQLIDDLLDTSRITAGKLRIEMRPTDLGPLVQASIDAVLPTAQAKGVDLTADVGAAIGIVRADPDRLQQVLWNLLNNSVKFTPAGGAVRISVTRRGADVEIRVTDTGIGIAREFLPHIFEPFRQADASTTRTYGGLGLGLAICKQLVEQHGGTIEAQSPGAGAGATFIIRLPLPATSVGAKRGGGGAAAAAAATDRSPQHDHPSHGLRDKRVLLVEDDPATRDALVRLLRQAGAEVTMTGSAEAAEKSFTASRPDVILCDIALPDGDGYKLIARLRSHEGAHTKHKRTPAVALTALARDQDREQAIAAGFDAHVAKPGDPDHLLAVLRSLVAQP